MNEKNILEGGSEKSEAELWNQIESVIALWLDADGEFLCSDGKRRSVNDIKTEISMRLDGDKKTAHIWNFWPKDLPDTQVMQLSEIISEIGDQRSKEK